MPIKPGFTALLGEWRTIVMSLRYTREHLQADADLMENEDDQLIAYDHLERLDRLIPRIERDLDEELEQEEAQLSSSISSQNS